MLHAFISYLTRESTSGVYVQNAEISLGYADQTEAVFGSM